MATKPFKFRYVDQIAGTFVAAIAVILVAAVVLAGRAQQWFVTATHVKVLLPLEGSFGLKVGGEVRMLGVTVGSVDRIDPPDDSGQMTMTVHVDRRFGQFIRQGVPGTPGSASQAIIHIPLALGESFLEFTRGQGPPLDLKTALRADRESGTGDAITQLVSDVRTRTLPAVQAALDQYELLAADLRSKDGPVQQTLAHLDQVTANLERRDSALGRLTTDPALAAEMNRAVVKLAASADQLQAVIADLQRTSAGLPAITAQGHDVMAQASAAIGNVRDSTAQLPATIASLKQSVDALPGVMAHTQQSLVEVERLVKGMEGLPLIRDHVDAAPAGGGALRPTDLSEAP